jgi:hypothetical protein
MTGLVKAFCLDCGECLGIYKPYYAEKHLKKYPLHKNFLVKTIIDPLTLENPDKWFNYHIPIMIRNLTEKKTDKDLIESNYD